MASTTIKQLVEAQLLAATATAILYQAPDGVVAGIHAATLCNRTAGVVACVVYITPKGGTVSDAYAFVTINLAPGKTYTCPELIGQKVSSGHEIHALGLNVSFAVGGVEVAGQ